MVDQGTGIDTAEYQRKERQLRKLKRSKPQLFLAKVHAIAKAIDELEKSALDEIDEFNRRTRPR